MKICTPIQEKTQKAALQRLKQLKGKVDLAEIWLDHIRDLDVKSLLKNTPLPVLCVCKKPNENGCFKGTYTEMADLLLEAAKNGAKYIDMPFAGLRSVDSEEFRTPSEIKVRRLRRVSDSFGDSVFSRLKKTKIIISHHDFKKTPPLKTLLKKAREMRKMGADLRAEACIVKIATMARSLEDAFTIISLAQLLQEEGTPHILIAMGKKGILSRVLTPFLGGTIMFAPLVAKKATASGQLTVSELREAWGMIKR